MSIPQMFCVRFRKGCLNAARSEGGSGTLLTAALCALGITCALVIAASAVVFTERSRLDAVSGVTALAAADISATAEFEDVADRPCDMAAQVAQANEVAVESCEVIGSDTRVILRSKRSVLGLNALIRSRARAGPMLSSRDTGVTNGEKISGNSQEDLMVP